MCLSPAVSVWSLNTTRPFASKDASILPSGLQARKSATRRLLKLLVSNCQSSAEKLPDFSAEVGEVLLCVFLTSRKDVVFVSYLVCKTEKNDFVFNKLKFLLEKFVCVI